MQPNNSIALRYDGGEDRILIVVRAGTPDECGYWLTRRLVLDIIERANPYLDRMSPVASQTPADLRGELATMERQVALARTQGDVGHVSDEVVAGAATAADLGVGLTITKKGANFIVQLRGRNAGQTSLVWSRDHLQRIVLIIEEMAVRAGWRGGAPVAPTQGQETAKPLRH